MKQNSFLTTRLGLNMLQIQKIVQMMKEKNGLILVCGPAGKDNSDALAAFFMLLRQEKRENKRPDVSVIEEIRSKRVAQITVQASLAGHLVLSSLRMDDPVDVFQRIVGFGIEPRVLASVLKGMIIENVIRKNGRRTVLVDIVSVHEKLVDMVVEQYGAEDLKVCFLHCTNVISEVLKSIKCLPPPVYSNCRKAAINELYRKNSAQEVEKKICRKKTGTIKVRSITGNSDRPFLIADNLLRLKRRHPSFGQNRYSIRVGRSETGTEFAVKHQTIPGEIIR
ncbi:MAG: ATPase, T2SS/T4P/T4SS family [Treponema sp.]